MSPCQYRKKQFEWQWFSLQKPWRPENKWYIFFTCLRKELSTTIFYPVKISFKNKEEIENEEEVKNKGRLRKFAISRPILKEWLDYVSKQKENDQRRNLATLGKRKEHSKQTYGLIKLAFLLILSFLNYVWQLKQKAYHCVMWF